MVRKASTWPFGGARPHAVRTVGRHECSDATFRRAYRGVETLMPEQRRPHLDGVRGLAIALVLLAHVTGVNGAGLVGVLLFFVLSGYLITSLLLAEHSRS